MALAQRGTSPSEEIRQAVMVFLPDDVPLEWTVLMALWGWLPLDHDGLIGTATCNDRLRGGTGWLFRESYSAAARKRTLKREIKRDKE